MHLASVLIDGEERLAFRLSEGRLASVAAAAQSASPVRRRTRSSS